MAAYVELDKLHGPIDPEMSATLAEGLVAFSMLMDVDDRDSAAHAACDAVRTALHAAGVATPQWESDVRRLIDAIPTSSIASAPASVRVGAPVATDGDFCLAG